MENNFGVKESLVDSKALFISETNSKGIITFVNDAFANIAGYDYNELVGQPHNMIRHPFMPKSAFSDLWKTVSSGGIWEGIVVNKTKQDGYYWVKATVFKSQNPDGSVKYISVRVKARDEEINEVIKLYPTLS